MAEHRWRRKVQMDDVRGTQPQNTSCIDPPIRFADHVLPRNRLSRLSFEAAPKGSHGRNKEGWLNAHILAQAVECRGDAFHAPESGTQQNMRNPHGGAG